MENTAPNPTAPAPSSAPSTSATVSPESSNTTPTAAASGESTTPDSQIEAVERLRERLGLAKPKPAAPAAATAAPAAATAPAAAAGGTDEAALRALAEEQLRLTKERRKFDDERKTDAETRKAEKAAAETFARLKKAMQQGNRVAVLRILHDDNLPEGALGEWAQELAVAMSGQTPSLTPDEIERVIDRRVEEREAKRKADDEKAAADAKAVRDEANQRYLGALDGAIKADPKRWPGLAKFGADATKVLRAVEESFAASGGKGVLPVVDVLNKLEAGLRADFEAAYGQQPSAQPTTTAAQPAAASAPQPTVTASVTTPETAPQPKSIRERDDEARREILRKVYEMQRAQKAR